MWIGTGSAGTLVRRKPSTLNVSPLKTTRSPARAARRNWAVSRTRVAGRLNVPPFHDSTMGCEPAPMPSTKRPGAMSARPAAGGRERGGPARVDVGDRGADPHPRGEPDDGAAA